jgi:hypothetical protein
MSTKAEVAEGLILKPEPGAETAGHWVFVADDALPPSSPDQPPESSQLLGQPGRVLVVSSDSQEELETIRAFIALLRTRIEGLEENEIEELIETAMPRLAERPHPEILDQARRNAEFRAEFLTHWPVLDAEQVHRLYGSRADNTAALAGQWRKAGRIFGVEHRGKTVFPAFQFDPDGRPKALVGRVLEALGPRSGWQIASWFTTPNGWLADDRRPVDLMDSDPDAVLAAARALTEANLY